MLGEPVLYRLADPVMACSSTVMYDGDTHGWHFDLNDFVVSILLRAPEMYERVVGRRVVYDT